MQNSVHYGKNEYRISTLIVSFFSAISKINLVIVEENYIFHATDVFIELSEQSRHNAKKKNYWNHKHCK